MIFLYIQLPKGTFPLPSISDSWYALPGKQNWLFTIFIWGLSIPLCMYEPSGSFNWYFTAGACLSFVGVATSFRDKNTPTPTIHYLGAVFGILFSFCGLFQDHLYVPIVLETMALFVIGVTNISNRIWWFEITSIVFAIIGLFIKTLH